MTAGAMKLTGNVSGGGQGRDGIDWPAATLILWPLLAAIAVAWSIWVLPDDLAPGARIALIITVLALIGWVATPLPESLVALTSAVALVLTGVVGESQLYAILGSDLVWLLLSAFVIAAVLKECGLAERMIAPILFARPAFSLFAFAMALAIALTAFLLPSTSGRAALLLPVFLAIIPHLPDERLRRPLALLFPTVILLSAGGSLIGAGAHLVAVEAIVATGGARLSYLDWITIGAPLAFLASASGVLLILLLFVPRELWFRRLQGTIASGAMTSRQYRVLVVVVMLVGLWLSEPLHGLGMALVAVIGALVLLTRPFTDSKTKDVFRAVDVELILYMAATTLIAQSMTQTGADRWMAEQVMGLLPSYMASSSAAMVVVVAALSIAAHLLIASRSARAAVLVPAVALPVAGLGHDATLMILVVVMGSGFCQTLMASAKPVAIYGMRDEAGFTQGDLARLALPLALSKLSLLVCFALFVWPHQFAGAVMHRDIVPKDDISIVTPQSASLIRATTGADVASTNAKEQRAESARATVGDRKASISTPKPKKPKPKVSKPKKSKFERDLINISNGIRRDFRRLFKL
jgi:di/tricarboxylate transporter